MTIFDINTLLVVKAENAKNLHVPLYKGLNIEAILEKGKQDDLVMRYLPDERDINRLPRQFVINLIYSLTGDNFRSFVSAAIKTRNEELA